MKSPALNRGVKKAVRALFQLAVGGALTGAVNAAADGLSPNMKIYVLTGWTVLLSFLQNGLETAGKIPVLLPTPGIVPSVGTVAGKAVGTVETTVETVGGAVGEVTGVIQDVAGGLLGEVVDVDKMPDEGA